MQDWEQWLFCPSSSGIFLLRFVYTIVFKTPSWETTWGSNLWKRNVVFTWDFKLFSAGPAQHMYNWERNVFSLPRNLPAARHASAGLQPMRLPQLLSLGWHLDTRCSQVAAAALCLPMQINAHWSQHFIKQDQDMQVTSYLMFHHHKNPLWKGAVLSFPSPSRAEPPSCDVLPPPVHLQGPGEQHHQDKK